MPCLYKNVYNMIHEDTCLHPFMSTSRAALLPQKIRDALRVVAMQAGLALGGATRVNAHKGRKVFDERLG